MYYQMIHERYMVGDSIHEMYVKDWIRSLIKIRPPLWQYNLNRYSFVTVPFDFVRPTPVCPVFTTSVLVHLTLRL